ncbi:MAG: polysaccharide deacetylase family protein [Opitutaceae bacterium]
MIPPLLLVVILAKIVGVALWFFTAQRMAAVLLFIGPDPFLLYAILVPSAQGLVRVFTRFATDRREIWLTIDDGPDPDDTPKILDLLDRHGAQATFFVIGERAARWPELVLEIVRRGHEIGHHTHTHPVASFWCASPRRLARELDRALTILRELGVRPRWFRAPVGIKHPLLARALGSRDLRCVGWTIRSGDCHSRSPDAMAASVAGRLHPGAVVLLHEGPSVPARARVTGLALLLAAATERGFSCVLPPADQLR